MRNHLLLALSLLLTGTAFGQVKGVSYTIAPSVSYNWFGDESGLSDAFMFGGRLGFGFGEYVELRATYMQTLDLDTDFDALGIGIDSTFGNQGVDLRRYGAELKLNIGRGRLLPYLVLGGGIQDTERDGIGLDAAENIFGTLGVGLTLSAADRYAFGVEGKYIAYSGSSVRNLLNEAERIDQGLDAVDLGNDNIGTFALAANLQFYLGGRRPGQLSDIDEEYLRNFQGGISGLSIPVELGLAQVDWDDALPYRDAYFAGATAGFAFGPLISLRGFYYQGMTDDEINFDFDDIALYGADFRFNLTQASSGIVPYLNVGGGYIDLSSGYNDGITEGAQFASSQGFASGGGGIYLKLGDRFLLNGGVRAMLTTGSDLEDLSNTDQLTTSTMYNAGLGFILGGDSQRDNPDVVRQSTLENRLDQQQADFERRADSIRMANQQEIADLRDRYQDTIARLDQEIQLALDDGDLETAQEIREERAEAAAIVQELDSRSDELDNQRVMADRAEIDAALGRPTRPVTRVPTTTTTPTYSTTPNGSIVILESPQIDRLIDAIGNRNGGGTIGNQPSTQQGGMSGDQIDQLNRRLDRMEDMMFRMNTGPQPQRRSYDDYNYDDRRSGAPRSDAERVQQLEDRLERLRDRNNLSDDDMTADERRIRDLERQLQDLEYGDDDYRSNLRAPERRDDDDDMTTDERRIRDLERQLEERRGNARENNDDSEERIQELERRMNERIENLRNSDDDDETEELRREMIGEMADYQSEMMEEIRDLQRDLSQANRELARREASEDELDRERDRLREERRALRLAAANSGTPLTDTTGAVIQPGTRSLDEIEVNTGGVYLADGNTEGFFSNFTYTGMSGTAGFNFGDATGLGLGLRWHYKLGPEQRAEFMPEAYFGIGSPTTFGIFGNIVYPILTERSESVGLIPYAGLGVGAMQIKDDENSDELNFRPAINLLIGTYLPVGNGRVFVDFSTRNFFSVNQLTGGYRFNF